jgi:NlpC/P60 family putative phage cell wall peptidase
MSTRQAIVTEARSWIGTRFHHQAATKGAGCDCIGLVRGVGIALGLYPANFTELPEYKQFAGYGRDPAAGALEKGCSIFGVQIPVAQARPGDVFLMHFGGDPRHVAFVGDYPGGGLSLIHAYAMTRKVVECRLDDVWQSRIYAAYALPGVAE